LRDFPSLSAVRRRCLPLLLAALAAPAMVASASAALISRPAWFGRGVASWYGPGFHGRRMANGRTFDQESDSCAHKTMAFGTRLLVRNLDNGRTARCVIEDRGPYITGRALDVSRHTARELGMLEAGTARVEWIVL
jgi:rare lipoprotein A